MSEKKEQIFLLGYYGAGNFGDDLVLKNILLVVPDSFRVLVCSRYCGSKPPGPKFVRFNLLSLPRVIREIFQSRAVVIGGGDIFQELTGRGSILISFFVSFWARVFGKRLILLSVSAGPIFSRLGRYFFKKISQWARLIITRGQNSDNFFKDFIGPDKKLVNGVDAAFFSPAPSEEPTDDWYERFPPGQKVFGISLREWFGDNPEEKEKKYRLLAEAVKYLIEVEKAKIIFLAYQYEKDRLIEEAVIKYLKNEFKVEGDIYNFNKAASYWQMWFCVKFSTALIGLRFHSLVMAAALEKPMLSLGYAPKNGELMTKLGLNDYNLSINDLEPEKFWEVFKKFLANLSSLEATVKKNLPQIYAEAENCQKLFLEELVA